MSPPQVAASCKTKTSNELELVEVGGASKMSAHRSAITTPTEIKIVTYNIRWSSGEDLQKLIALLQKDTEIGGATIIALQEVDRNTRRNGCVNTASMIAEALGMNYAWAAPPLAPGSEKTEDETGVAILSPYPLTDVERLVLPNPGPGERRRAGIGATIMLGSQSIRVYSVHAETRIPTQKKVEQLKHVLDSLERRPQGMRAVVLGDLNTWRPDDKRSMIRLFTEADFVTPFPPGQRTFRLPVVKWRLDWIWLRGFASVTAYGIDRDIELSDHYPLWLNAKL